MFGGKTRLSVMLVGLVLLSFVSSCVGKRGVDSTSSSPLNSPLPTPSSANTPTSPPATAVPSSETASFNVSDPEEGMGTVMGTIYDESRDEPYAGQFIYLAKVMELESSNEDDPPALFAELDVQSDPFDQTDEHGRFLIENVHPGLYALAVRLPSLRETLLYDADTEQSLSVEIEAGEISDLGTVHILGPR